MSLFVSFYMATLPNLKKACNKYLIPKVDLEKVNSDGQTFVNILLDELDRNSQETVQTVSKTLHLITLL